MQTTLARNCAIAKHDFISFGVSCGSKEANEMKKKNKTAHEKEIDI